MNDPTATLPDSAVHDLGLQLRGTLLRPRDAGFDAARRVWNGMIDRVPASIVRCACRDDVVAAIRTAREHNLLVAVRGGGHNVAGTAVCDGGMVIDLSAIKELWVDRAAGTVRAAAGLTWGELDRATAPFGLATTGGLVSSTGIAGLTLGGGLGWLMRRYGLVCDNLLSAELVTAAGEVLTASADEHADLFWGLRGGGGNLGVVTAFSYRLYPVRTVLAGTVTYPWQRAGDVLRFFRDYSLVIPDSLMLHALLHRLPGGAAAATLFACGCGDIEANKRALSPLRAFGTPLADTIAPRPYPAWQTALDADWPHGLRHYWKSSFLRGLDDDAIATLLARFPAAPSSGSSILIERMGGAVGRVAEDATAFPYRGADWDLLIAAKWEQPADDAPNIAWAREAFAAIEPFTREMAYVNYLGDEGEERVRAAYGSAKYDRMVALKSRYDPTNLFRVNQNIKPAQR